MSESEQGSTQRPQEYELPTQSAELVLRLVRPSDADSATEDAPARDDDYYAEVRESVGRGTPSILLGTSRRALDRSLEKLRQAQRRG